MKPPGGRTNLLSAIQKGTSLKKTKTRDSSTIAGKEVVTGDSSMVAGLDQLKISNASRPMAVTTTTSTPSTGSLMDAIKGGQTMLRKNKNT